MFPNVRLMAASTLASILALFFAFGVYASLRVSHEPLVARSRSAPLQLVGLNVAMLPITVLEPFALQRSASVNGERGSALAYSAAPTSLPPLPVTGASDPNEDNAAADAPAENSDLTKTNSDVTQVPDTTRREAARDTKSSGEAMQESAEPNETLPPDVTESAALPAPTETAPLPAPLPVSPSQAASAPAVPQNSPVEQTAVIETIATANVDDAAVDTEIPAKEKKKKHAAKRHLYRAQPRAVAQTSPPQVTSYPAGIGGPFVSAKK
jgi:hypothetical protein